MPTLKQVRASLISRVAAYWQATYPAVKMYYDNAYPKDAEIDKLQSFVLCSIRFSGATQMNIAPTPGHRTYGKLVFTAATRVGSGSSKVLEYIDGLSDNLRYAQIDGLIIGVPSAGVPITQDGWFSYDLNVPFLFDSLS